MTVRTGVALLAGGFLSLCLAVTPADAQRAGAGFAPAELALWREVVAGEACAGRDAARLIPRVLEGTVTTAGDDPSSANVDLQNALQKLQRTMQTLSNVAKSKHDTAKSAINNVRCS